MAKIEKKKHTNWSNYYCPITKLGTLCHNGFGAGSGRVPEKVLEEIPEQIPGTGSGVGSGTGSRTSSGGDSAGNSAASSGGGSGINSGIESGVGSGTGFRRNFRSRFRKRFLSRVRNRFVGANSEILIPEYIIPEQVREYRFQNIFRIDSKNVLLGIFLRLIKRSLVCKTSVLRTFNSYSTTTHHTLLIIHHSSYTTAHTPLIIHQSSYTAHTPALVSTAQAPGNSSSRCRFRGRCSTL